jgi:hypothetical protein
MLSEGTGIVSDDRRLRRWTGWAVLVALLLLASWILPRLLPRSPMTLLVACVLAVATMKLAERRIRQWLRRYEERNRPGPRRP